VTPVQSPLPREVGEIFYRIAGMERPRAFWALTVDKLAGLKYNIFGIFGYL